MRSPASVLLAALGLAGCQGVDRSVALNPDQTVAVTSVAAPVAVSAIDRPVTIAAVAQPVTISGVAQPVAVSAVVEPVTISSVAAVRLVRPELDPDRIESGNGTSGRAAACASTCTELVSGPFILTDLVVGESAVTVRVGGSPGTPRWTGFFPATTTITGGRFAVRSGEVLVVESAALGHLTWSGFRP